LNCAGAFAAPSSSAQSAASIVFRFVVIVFIVCSFFESHPSTEWSFHLTAEIVNSGFCGKFRKCRGATRVKG
jgi:hypothetical protein